MALQPDELYVISKRHWFQPITDGRGKEKCPACSILPFSTRPLGLEAPPLAFSLAKHESKLDAIREWSIDKGYPPPCDLCRLITDLDQQWSGLKATDGMPRQKYFSTCGPPYLSICTEQDSWGIMRAPAGAVVYTDPLCVQTIARLQRWIATCDKDHDNCKRLANPALPTRVLDVGTEGVTQAVMLVETNGQSGKYIALSHCWGESKRFITTKSTLEDMKRGFPPEQAPATFYDAIRVARKLGVRYLWIDSLCIIQDDPRDWQIESSQMGDVYGNAYLTIAASTAANDSEGFLQPRPFNYSVLNIASRSGEEKFKVYLNHTGQPCFTGDPLDSRGWTLQESKLSRRVLRYSNSRMSWLCQSSRWDETESDNGSRYWTTGDSVTNLCRQPQGDNPYISWYSMICFDYSGRKLTYESDKLPALSGLASLVANRDHSKYCAGIWWEGVAYGLCWRAVNWPGASLSKPAKYLAPSWSWASVIGRIDFPGFTGGAHMEYTRPTALQSVNFTDFSLTPKGENPYGEIENGWIRLETPLFSLRALSRGNPAWQEHRAGQTFKLDGLERPVGVEFDFPNEDEKGVFAFFLLGSKPNQGNQDRKLFSGLVVRLSGDPVLPGCKDARRYRRVGYLSLEATPQFEQVFLRGSYTKLTDIVLY